MSFVIIGPKYTRRAGDHHHHLLAGKRALSLQFIDGRWYPGHHLIDTECTRGTKCSATKCIRAHICSASKCTRTKCSFAYCTGGYKCSTAKWTTLPKVLSVLLTFALEVPRAPQPSALDGTKYSRECALEVPCTHITNVQDIPYARPRSAP